MRESLKARERKQDGDERYEGQISGERRERPLWEMKEKKRETDSSSGNWNVDRWLVREMKFLSAWKSEGEEKENTLENQMSHYFGNLSCLRIF